MSKIVSKTCTDKKHRTRIRKEDHACFLALGIGFTLRPTLVPHATIAYKGKVSTCEKESLFLAALPNVVWGGGWT